jgi:hypothetical protein
VIPLDLLLAMRGRWEKKALGLFLATFAEEEAEVVLVGRSGISTDRWLTALLAVWEGSGDEWAEQVAVSINTDQEVAEAMFFLSGAGLRFTKGVRDEPGSWRRLIEFITIKATAIVDTTLEEFAINGLDAYGSAATRAETMAASEVVQATNFAQAETVKAKAPLLLKIWQAIIDDRTRQTHLDANGQIRKLNDPYDVGGTTLQWPADAGGPLREVINCRCWEDYEVPAERRG